MKLDEILTKAGKHKRSRRIGRGIGSGRGKTSGRGVKGAGSRSGWKQLVGFEGGQNPIFARVPKRGFSNFKFHKEYQIVNVCDLEKFDDGAKVDATALFAVNLVSDAKKPVKILGTGELTKKLTVVAQKFSASAAAKIAKTGGVVEQAK